MLPERPVEKPRLMFEVKLLQVFQRNAGLLLPTAETQTLHTTLEDRQADTEHEGSTVECQ